MAAQELDFTAFFAWEVDLEENRPLFRSVLPIFMYCGIPLRILNAFIPTLSARLVLYAPRVFVFCISLLNDLIVRAIMRHASFKLSNQASERIMLIHNSSWTTLLFFSRTFSNTLETFLLNLFILTCLNQRGVNEAMSSSTPMSKANLQPRWKLFNELLRNMILGAVLCFGCFTRITFPAFALPVCLYTLYCRDDSFETEHRKQLDAPPTITLRLQKHGFFLMRCLLGFGLLLVVIVVYDSLYVLQRQHRNVSSMTELFSMLQLSPLNNLLYNMKEENLKNHGLHPFYFHFLVNLNLMFTPFAYCFIPVLLAVGKKRFQRADEQMREDNAKATAGKTLMACTVLSGLLILSLFPHQEGRFLLPLVFPVAVLSADEIMKTQKRRMSWFMVNALLVLFYGFVHQAGIVPSLLFFKDNETTLLSSNASSSCFLTYEAYITPRFLLTHQANQYRGRLVFKDIEQNDINEEMERFILEQDEYKGCLELFLLLPRVARQDIQFFSDAQQEVTTEIHCERVDGETAKRHELCFQQIYTYFPHFSGERIGAKLDDFYFDLIKLS